MSLIAWVDVDHQRSDEMNELLDAVGSPTMLDELGIGSVRDALSDLLFPGTSTLHTRARYLLYTAWGVTSATGQRNAEVAATALREHEVGLIKALSKASDVQGLIGGRSGDRLVRTPTAIYWTALRRYGIRRCAESQQQHLRSATARPAHNAEEDDAPGRRHTDPHFVQLPPEPDSVDEPRTFNLTSDEADFLHERIQDTCAGTYLAWLLDHRTIAPGIDYPWHGPTADGVGADIARVLAHAERLSHLIHGAHLLYNYLIAAHIGADKAVAEWAGQLDAWAQCGGVQRSLAHWDGGDFWATVTEHQPTAARARLFVDEWISLIADDPAAGWRSEQAADLIRSREMRLKSRKSRFVRHVELEAVERGFGSGQLTYRWSNAVTLVNDIRRGRGLDDA